MVTRLHAARCRLADTCPGLAQDPVLFIQKVEAAAGPVSTVAGPLG